MLNPFSAFIWLLVLHFIWPIPVTLLRVHKSWINQLVYIDRNTKNTPFLMWPGCGFTFCISFKESLRYHIIDVPLVLESMANLELGTGSYLWASRRWFEAECYKVVRSFMKSVKFFGATNNHKSSSLFSGFSTCFIKRDIYTSHEVINDCNIHVLDD